MRTLLLLLAVVFMFVLLFGCTPKGYWTKDGLTQEQWQRERYECQYRAESTCQYWNPNVGVLPGIICVQNHFKQCLYGHGYRWVEGTPDLKFPADNL